MIHFYTLYRAYSADGELLYVGVSIDPRRLGFHNSFAPWWLEAARVELEHLGEIGRTAALAAEAAAIAAERPRFNVVGNTGNPERVHVHEAKARDYRRLIAAAALND